MKRELLPVAITVWLLYMFDLLTDLYSSDLWMISFFASFLKHMAVHNVYENMSNLKDFTGGSHVPVS